jgi:predicted TIM-barrel fold metal-dependent hydrolase
MSDTQVRQKLISADSHVTITDESFFRNLPEKHHEAVNGAVEVQRAAVAAMNMPNNREGRDWPAQGRPGDADQKERLQDQDIDGVSAEVLYVQGTFGFDGGLFYRLKEAEDRVAAFRAYNDAMTEWIQAAPDRLLPVGIIPIAEPDEAVAELKRLLDLGFKAVQVSGYPDVYDYPSFANDRYTPLWKTLSEARMPLSLHTTATKGLSFVRDGDPTPAKGIFQSLPPMFMAEILGTFIAGGVLKANPDLHIVLVEAGIGWIPYYLERLDTMHRRHNWAKRGMMEELPSTFWYRQCHATFEDDMVGMEILDRVGVNNVMWASDYPHPDSTWPESQEVVVKHFEHLPDEQKQAICWKNAADLYKIGV